MIPVRSATLWKYSLREIQRRPGRTLLTVLGIVIGVAATVAISVTIHTVRRAHEEMFETVSGKADLEVLAEGQGGFRIEDVSAAVAIDEVRAAVPAIQIPAAVVGAKGALPVLVLGIDPQKDKTARNYQLRRGLFLDRSPGLLIEVGFAEANRFQIGQKISLVTPKGFARLPIAGLLEPRGAATFNGGAVVFMPLAMAQQAFNLAGKINSLQLVLVDGLDLQEIQNRLQERLPRGFTVQPPGNRGATGRDSMVSTEQGLAAMSLTSLVAGAFVIMNAFLMNLGERRRQLAILRALGATRRQVFRLLLREALVLGLVGTAIGLLAGWGLSIGLRQVMGYLTALNMPELTWSIEPFVMAVLLGPGMAMAATYVPAKRVGNREPLPELVHKRGIRSDHLSRWPGYVGLTMLLTTCLLVVGVVAKWFPSSVVIPLLAPGMAMFLVGCVLSIRLIYGPLCWFAAWLTRHLLGTEGSLAFRQLQRQQGRTVLTVSVLLLAVIFAIGFGQSLMNNMDDIYKWLDHVADGDFFIRGTWPDMTVAINTAALPESLAEEIRQIDPVRIQRVDKFRYILARVQGRQVAILAFTYPTAGPLPLDLVEGDAEEVRAGLLRGQVVLGGALSQRLQLGKGQTITLETRDGPKKIPIVGVANEYTGGGMALYMDWRPAMNRFNVDGVHTFLITAKKGQAQSLAGPIKSFAEKRNYLYHSLADLRGVFESQTAGFLGFVWMLLALVFVVASLGIINTLTMNVLEQTSELGMLRAIGMKRSQVRKMIFAQALSLGVISLAPGAIAGIGLAYLMNLSTYPLVGNPVVFHVDALFVIGCFAATLMITLLAAYFPARRAARLQVIEALQYE